MVGRAFWVCLEGLCQSCLRPAKASSIPQTLEAVGTCFLAAETCFRAKDAVAWAQEGRLGALGISLWTLSISCCKTPPQAPEKS